MTDPKAAASAEPVAIVSSDDNDSVYATVQWLLNPMPAGSLLYEHPFDTSERIALLEDVLRDLLRQVRVFVEQHGEADFETGRANAALGEMMFGLTKREQRWAAEQKAAETLVPLVIAAIEARAEMDTNERIALLESLLREALQWTPHHRQNSLHERIRAALGEG